MKPRETCNMQQVQPLSNKIIDWKATQQRSGYTQTNTLMCVGFMMIRCLFILLKKVNLIKWQVSRPLKFFQLSRDDSQILEIKSKVSIYTKEKLAVSKFCAKTLLFAIQCSSLYWLKVFQKSGGTLTLSCFQDITCKHLNEPMTWVWGRTICFLWTNGKFIKHFFIWDCLFGTTKNTLYLYTLHLLPNIQTWHQ